MTIIIILITVNIMINLCQYQHVFGKENVGIHSYRIMNIAMFDLVLTVLVAWLISKYFKKSFILILLILLIISLLIHRIFCVQSTLTKLVFGNF